MISAKNLNKYFETTVKQPGLLGSIRTFLNPQKISKKAIENFDLEIGNNEIVGLLGPNGAGKTTLMKMFTGIVTPTSGELSVLGFRPGDRDKEFRKNIAIVMGQKSQLWWDIPAMDSLYLLKSYYEIDDQTFNQKIEEMATLLNVKHVLHIHVRKLSLGERMKLELLASLLHSPKILFLDEPTIGLDLISQENMRHFIKKYHRENKVSIIITSHYMADVKELCSRIVLVLNGKKAFDDSIAQFEKILGPDQTVNFWFEQAIELDSSLINQNVNLASDGKSMQVTAAPQQLKELCSYILQKYPVAEFQSEKTPIERVMKELMKNPEIIHVK